MPPIRNPSLSKFHRLVGNKESLAELVLRLFSGHYDIMLNQPEFYHRPPPGPAPDPRLMPHRVWSLGPAVSTLSSTKRVWQQRRNSLRERESWTHPGPGLGCLPAPLMFVCWQVFAEYEINLSLSLASRELGTEFSKYSTGRISNAKTKQ